MPRKLINLKELRTGSELLCVVPLSYKGRHLVAKGDRVTFLESAGGEATETVVIRKADGSIVLLSQWALKMAFTGNEKDPSGSGT